MSLWLLFSLGQSTLKIIFLTNLLTCFKNSQHMQVLLEYEVKPSNMLAHQPHKHAAKLCISLH